MASENHVALYFRLAIIKRIEPEEVCNEIIFAYGC